MQMGRSLGVGLGLVLLLCALEPRSARACLQPAPPRALVGYPAHGADDIPTDVVPFYDAVTADLGELGAVSFRLESASGDVIPVTSDSKYVWSFTLTPARSLEPQTTYTLTAAIAMDPNASPLAPISFSTGAGPMPGLPRASP